MNAQGQLHPARLSRQQRALLQGILTRDTSRLPGAQFFYDPPTDAGDGGPPHLLTPPRTIWLPWLHGWGEPCILHLRRAMVFSAFGIVAEYEFSDSRMPSVLVKLYLKHFFYPPYDARHGERPYRPHVLGHGVVTQDDAFVEAAATLVLGTFMPHQVASLLGAYDSDEAIVLVTRFVQGAMPLAWWLAGERRLHDRESPFIRRVVRDMIDADATMHEHGIAHRDATLENRLVDRAQPNPDRLVVMLVDFALASGVDEELVIRTAKPHCELRPATSTTTTTTGARDRARTPSCATTACARACKRSRH